MPLVLNQDLFTALSVAPFMAADESSAAQNGAQDILRTKVESRLGKIHVEATIVDMATQKNRGVNDTESAPADLVNALNGLARKIDSHAGPFSSKSQEAMQDFAIAAQTRDPQLRAQLLSKAITIDRSFGLAYIVMIEMLAPMGPPAYKAVLDQGRANSMSFTPYDRAKFDLIAGQFTHEPLSKQSAAAEAVLKLAPNDVDSLGLLGGVRFFEGDAAGGRKALTHALELKPNNASLQSQFARGLIETRQFSEAEKILASLDKNPAVLPELAICVLLQGDIARANGVAERFFASIKNAELETVLRSSWLDITGQRAKAIQSLETAKFTNKSIAGVALSEAAIWRLMDKDAAGAKKDAALASQADNGPKSLPALVSLLIDGGGGAAGWRQKIESSALNEQVKQPLLGYGFFLNGHYAEAAQIWRRTLDLSQGTDLRARAMLASSLNQSGKADEARKLSVQPFVIEFGDVYGSIAFGEMRKLLRLLNH